jgi:hypothetical protein
MRLLVCGDRDYQHRAFLEGYLDAFSTMNEIDVVIEGEARGADTFARNWAVKNGIHCMAFPADWEKYGKAAGPIRNTQMLHDGRPDMVIAFHDDFENSRGTKNMIEQAQKAGLPTRVVSL